MTIAKRLIILLAVPLVALLGLGIFTGLQLSKIEARSRFVSESRVEALATLGNLSRSFAELRVAVRNHLLAGNEAQRTAARAAFDESEREVVRLLRHYADNLVASDQGHRLVIQYHALGRDWIAGAKQAMSLAAQNRRDEAIALLKGQTTTVGEQLSKISSEWIKHTEDQARLPGQQVNEAIHESRWEILVGNMVGLLLTGSIGYFTFRRIVEPVHALDASVKTIAGGDFAKKVPFITATDETGDLARSIEVLKQGAAARDEQRWVKSSAAKLTGELQGAASLPQFGERLLSGLVPLLGGGVAACYVLEEDPGPLRRIAAYGLAEGADAANELGVGHGLVGQCARERKVITLTNLPSDYLRISSGLGSAPPVQSVALPLLSQDTLQGAVEIASFRAFNSQEQALLDEVMPVVALSLDVLQRNLQTQKLLARTQEQARQLTEQQEQLKASEDRFRLILESTAEGIFGVDTQGRITFINPPACRMLGFTGDELLGKPCHLTFHHHHSDGSVYPVEDCPMYAAYEQGTASRIDNELLWRKDGAGLPVEYGATPMLKDGAVVGAVISFSDITLRQQQEKQILAAKEKAEEATLIKSMFLANMSHEIRTPMNAIIGLSHLALKTPLNLKQRDYVSKIHNAGTSLLAVINDILDFSKIEAGKLDVENIDFKLDEVISSVTTLTGQKAHEKGLEFLAHVAAGIPESLRGDPLRLGQILTNLVNNAVKFTERGEIRLNIELVERTGDKVQLKFSVRDTGIGMSGEQAAKLFQPFMQADMSTSRKHGGTGLGLTICLRLVELMGGRIWLESEPGAGCTFYFTVWLGVSEIKGSGKTVPAKLANLRVLVVDDNPTAREILQEPLSALTSRADAVGSGKEAIDAIRQHDGSHPYDIVFMDWRMPGMDGLQASRHIKSDETLQHQPAIVLVTAFGREEVREEAERLRLDGFLVKPVTKSMIVDTLVNVFGHEGEGLVAAVGGQPTARLRGARILLAEDNDINQQIAVELLEGAGATVTVASNGREAVEILSNAPQPPPFDVVLMDLQMPTMDGYQATARLRSDARFATLPIIAMTAHATIEERQRCLAAGMNDHISKPIDPENLFQTVGRYCQPRLDTFPSDAASGGVELERGERDSSHNEVPSIQGLDTADGLGRVAGNRTLYLTLLRRFMEQQGPVPAQIVEALDRHDDALAERLAHTIKGLAGSIGARNLQSMGANLEKAIATRMPAAELMPQLRTFGGAMGDLVSRIRAALPPEDTSSQLAVASMPLDPGESKRFLDEMMSYLNNLDPSAAECLQANRAVFRALLPGDLYTRFEQSVHDFAYADALTQLQLAAKERGLHPA
jgi:two-component system sensor histidine kinase/response regulator